MAYQANSPGSLDNNQMAAGKNGLSFIKKYIAKPLTITLAAGMISLPSYQPAIAGEGLNLRINRDDRAETKIGAMYSIPIPFFGEGINTKYNSRNKNLEAQVAGLGSAPKIYGEESSQPYYETYDGNWSTKSAKELGDGMISPIKPYSTKADGTKRWLPGYSTFTKEGSIAAPIYGIFASAINGTSKLCGSEYRVYNPFQANFWRTTGTAITEIIAGMSIGGGGGGGIGGGGSSPPGAGGGTL